jgi:hypothetical protein
MEGDVKGVLGNSLAELELQGQDWRKFPEEIKIGVTV